MRIDTRCLEETKKQFALDYNAEAGKWITDRVCLSPVKILEGARIHEKQDRFFHVGILLGKAYVMADEVLHPWICQELIKRPPEWWGAFSCLRQIDRELNKYGRQILDTHIFFLPWEEEKAIKPAYEISWYEGDALEQFRGREKFSHALCFSKTQPDRIAVAATVEDGPVAMAGVSEDGAYLWQIGIDVCREYAGRGLGKDLVSLMKKEVLARGKVPYYGTAESHSISRSVGISSGFLPAWSEICSCKA